MPEVSKQAISLHYRYRTSTRHFMPKANQVHSTEYQVPKYLFNTFMYLPKSVTQYINWTISEST
jgi:hypothetical protein